MDSTQAGSVTGSARPRAAMAAAAPGESVGWLLIMTAAISWGTIGTADKFLTERVSIGPAVIGDMRLLVGSPLLLAAAYWIDGPIHIRRPAFLIGGVCMAAYQLFFFGGVPLAGVAVTTLLTICTAPLMIALISAYFFKERFTTRVLLVLAGGVVGTALLVGGADVHAGKHFLLGALLALGAAFSYSLFAIMTKVGLGDTKPVTQGALTISVAAILLLPVALLSHPTPSMIALGWPFILYLGVVTTALAYALYTMGLHRTTPTKASIAGLLEPLTATLLGVAIFHEQLGVLGWIGAALLIGALLALSVPSPGRRAVTIPEMIPEAESSDRDATG